ncbi:hypothetical protein F5888DRAFT_1805087 [Russula emetica]|nr:hypothetical protein F5888DRAFT_1805087 [Russula emetica]
MLKAEILEAPGRISSTADGWTADNTKASFLGMTASWIEVKGGKWNLCSKVVGFQPVSGDHSGWNLGRCFGHVVNIANVAVMGWITKIAAIENASAIWEYDPSLPNNRILGGSLDVIAAICTIAVKCIKYFEKLQLQCKFDQPLRIPLHSNTQWGSAQRMLKRLHKLRKGLFVSLLASSSEGLGAFVRPSSSC